MDWQSELISAIFWLFKAFFWVALSLVVLAIVLKRSSFGQKFWLIAKPCFHRDNALKALLMVGLLVFFVLLEVKISVLNTMFYNQLYSALQDANAQVFWFFAGLNAALVLFRVLQEIVDRFVGEAFEIFWLNALNAMLLTRWLNHKNYYRLHYQNNAPDNVDQRIEQDAREFVTTTVVLLRGIINAVMSTVEFSIILWGLSGVLMLAGFAISKGMVFFIYVFIIIATLISVWIGKYGVLIICA